MAGNFDEGTCHHTIPLSHCGRIKHFKQAKERSSFPSISSNETPGYLSNNKTELLAKTLNDESMLRSSRVRRSSLDPPDYMLPGPQLR